MAVPIDSKLYEKIKKDVYELYPKHSAYRSAILVKRYKDAGGKYYKDNKKKGLNEWFDKEHWVDMLEYSKGNIKPCGYSVNSVCRPLKSNKLLTADKFTIEQIKKAIELKKKDEIINWSKL